MLQPANVTIPDAACAGFMVQARAAPAVPVPEVIEIVTCVVLSAAEVFPFASCSVTTGCGVSGAPVTAPPGCVEKIRVAAAPGLTVKGELLPAASVSPLV